MARWYKSEFGPPRTQALDMELCRAEVNPSKLGSTWNWRVFFGRARFNEPAPEFGRRLESYGDARSQGGAKARAVAVCKAIVRRPSFRGSR